MNSTLIVSICIPVHFCYINTPL